MRNRMPYISSEWILNIMIGNFGYRLFNCGITSQPLFTGISISMTTTSGSWALTFSRTSLPFAASSMTEISAVLDNICLMPCRTTAWSSATSTLITSDLGVCFMIQVGLSPQPSFLYPPPPETQPLHPEKEPAHEFLSVRETANPQFCPEACLYHCLQFPE